LTLDKLQTTSRFISSSTYILYWFVFFRLKNYVNQIPTDPAFVTKQFTGYAVAKLITGINSGLMTLFGAFALVA